MPGPGDHVDEMDDLHDDPRLRALLEELRRSLTASPDEQIARRHLTAMRDAAADTEPSGWWARFAERRAVRRNPAPAFAPRWLAAGLAALLGLTGGLAAADVLPDSAQRVVARTVSHVGLDLPDPDDRGHSADVDAQNDEDDVDAQNDEVDVEADDHGKTVVSVAQDESLEGCEKGQAVRDEASSKNEADEDAPGLDHDPCPGVEDTETSDDSDTHRRDGEFRPAGDVVTGENAGDDHQDGAGMPEGAGPPGRAGPLGGG